MEKETNNSSGVPEASLDDEETSSTADRSGAASRARNRTVMLTPEMTGQVRSMLDTDEPVSHDAVSDPVSELLPPVQWDRPGAAQPSSAASTEDSQPPTFGGRADTGAAPYAEAERTMVQQSPAFSVNTQQAPRPTAAPAGLGVGSVGASKVPDSKIVGFLISFDKNENGEVFEIRAGRFLLTSRPTDHGEFILIDDATISPLHAIIRATADGKIQILDQLSEHGTGVTAAGQTEEEEITGSMIMVDHGDHVRFGKRNFIVCLVPKE